MTDPVPTTRPEAAVIGEMGRSLGTLGTAPIEVDDHRRLFVVPNGYHVEDSDTIGTAEAPRRATGRVTLTTTDSFVTYARRYDSPANLFYADPDDLAVVAVFNDHSPTVPGWRDHTARLQLTATPGWLRWTRANAKFQDQESFAELVEEGITEIATPAGADLLELAQSIKASTSAQFRSDRRLTSGQVQLTYVETIDAKAGADGSMTIPASIWLVLEPFYGATSIPVEARLRYRIAGGKLALGVWLVRHVEALRDAFDAELAKIEEGTGLRPLWGSS